jgi:hypothetical protein
MLVDLRKLKNIAGLKCSTSSDTVNLVIEPSVDDIR